MTSKIDPVKLEAAIVETNRLTRELDITNPDHMTDKTETPLYAHPAAQPERELSEPTKRMEKILGADFVRYSAQPVGDCPSCHGLNTSCPDGCGRDPETGELNGTRLAAECGEFQPAVKAYLEGNRDD